jgi:hypothetical protein
MLCPCCGNEINRGVRECGCGARFVGEPLDEKPVKIQSYGAIMNTVGLLALVVVTALTFTKFLAFGAVLVIWSAWRAMKLAKGDPEGYGGYRTATAMLTITLIAGIGIAGYTVTYGIPKFLKNREIRRDAATKASMLHYQANVLEEYKRIYGSYPRNAQEAAKVTNEPTPADYWNHNISYVSRIGAVANASNLTGASISVSNFELRSKGPDEKENTDDDIIMRDGIFYTAAELKNLLLVNAATDKK